MPPNESRTNLSLIERLKDREDSAWQHLMDFYGPIVYRFAISRGLDHDLAEEVRSCCYAAVVNQIDGFEYDPNRGRFRNWLLTIASRRIADLSRRAKALQADTRALEMIETKEPPPAMLWEQHWRQQILVEAYQRVERRVGQDSYEIFRRLIRETQPVQQIAAELSISENQIYKTKQRCIAMLREEITFLENDPLTAG